MSFSLSKEPKEKSVYRSWCLVIAAVTPTKTQSRHSHSGKGGMLGAAALAQLEPLSLFSATGQQFPRNLIREPVYRVEACTKSPGQYYRPLAFPDQAIISSKASSEPPHLSKEREKKKGGRQLS